MALSSNLSQNIKFNNVLFSLSTSIIVSKCKVGVWLGNVFTHK